MFDKFRPAWAEVYIDNIVHNFNEIRSVTDKKAKIMGVVKANAYGHGSCEVAKVLLNNGADYLAVATIDEAVELRYCGINAPILILGYTPLNQADNLIEYQITQTVFELRYAKELSKAALKHNKPAKIHIKIDTGMGRIGYNDIELAEKEIVEIANMDGIILEGIFSHFAAADDGDEAYSRKQYDIFKGLVTRLSERGINIPFKHMANSAAILDLKYTHMDMVRPGILLYGSYPSDEIKNRIDLKQTMALKTRVVYVKDVPKGESISYGRTFVTKKRSKIATLPIGYADGLNRLLSNNHEVIIKGEYAPIIGKICMDQCMIDVTDVRGVEVGDEVVIFGEQGGKKITADDIAKKLNTISYEVYCGISRRVPRIYIDNGKILSVKNYLKY